VVFWEVRVIRDIVTNVLEQPIAYTLRLEGEDGAVRYLQNVDTYPPVYTI
jgi:hypothetical protein